MNGTSTNWSRTVDLPNQGNWNVTAYAVDAAGPARPRNTDHGPVPGLPGRRRPDADRRPVGSDRERVLHRRHDLRQRPRRGHEPPVKDRGDQQGRGRDHGQRPGSTSPRRAPSPGRELAARVPDEHRDTWLQLSYTTPVLPAGSYTVKVRAIDQHGWSRPTPSVRHVTVSIPAGNVKPRRCCRRLPGADNVCQFDARTRPTRTPPTLTYTWNFGTGTTGTGPNPKKTFTAAGDFTVTLTAKDEWGVASTRSRDGPHRRAGRQHGAGPEDPATVVQRLTCNFSRSVRRTTSVTPSPTRGTSATPPTTPRPGQRPRTSSPDAGTYTVTLTATDGWGKSTTSPGTSQSSHHKAGADVV